MQQIPGKLVNSDGETVAETDIWIEVVAPPGGLKSWHGQCVLPTNHKVSINESTYRLELSDGRSGDIIVTNLTMGSHEPAQVVFQGTGPLGIGI